MGNKALKFVTTLAVFIVPLVAFAGTAHADTPGGVLTWVNGLRGTAGIAPLAANTGLGAVAQQWANQMATTDVLANNPNLSSQAPTGWTHIGENIGDGYNLAAIETILARGRSTLTLDMGGTASPEQLGTAISNQTSSR